MERYYRRVGRLRDIIVVECGAASHRARLRNGGDAKGEPSETAVSRQKEPLAVRKSRRKEQPERDPARDKAALAVSKLRCAWVVAVVVAVMVAVVMWW